CRSPPTRWLWSISRSWTLPRRRRLAPAHGELLLPERQAAGEALAAKEAPRGPARLPRPVAWAIFASMSEVTRILSAIQQGDPSAAEQLLPLVYDELRRLAAERLAQERPGQTLQPTALVHEAYLRLAGGEQARRWDGRGHFFAAAAE